MSQQLDRLWTVVVGFDGGTYVAQTRAPTLADALHAYNAADPSGLGLRIPAADPADAPMALDGLTGVWCTDALTATGDLGLVHVIATDAAGAERG